MLEIMSRETIWRARVCPCRRCPGELADGRRRSVASAGPLQQGEQAAGAEAAVDDELAQIEATALLDLDGPYAGIVRDEDGGLGARPGHAPKPANQLTWDGASLYCNGRGKRLPTEAEREFAARGRIGRRFRWGEQQPRCDEVVWGRQSGMPCGPSPPTPGLGPLDVGTAPLDRTPEDVRDMGGNVMEWAPLITENQMNELNMMMKTNGAASDTKLTTSDGVAMRHDIERLQ
jgi:formylglycine-generating enzyme required for sulfatase activity